MSRKITRLHEYGNNNKTFNILLNDAVPNRFTQFVKNYNIGDKVKCMLHGDGIVIGIKTKQSALGPIKTLIVQKILDVSVYCVII